MKNLMFCLSAAAFAVAVASVSAFPAACDMAQDCGSFLPELLVALSAVFSAMACVSFIHIGRNCK